MKIGRGNASLPGEKDSGQQDDHHEHRKTGGDEGCKDQDRGQLGITSVFLCENGSHGCRGHGGLENDDLVPQGGELKNQARPRGQQGLNDQFDADSNQHDYPDFLQVPEIKHHPDCQRNKKSIGIRNYAECLVNAAYDRSVM